MASMVGTDISRPVRKILNDEDPTYTWTDAELIFWLNAFTDILIRARPDARLDSSNAVLTIVEITTIGGALSTDSKWKSAYIEYLLMRAFEGRSDSKENESRAAGHKAGWERMLSI